ncbi:hypothetical protein Clacol_001431 [Clathrus columnatus]|uniref:F-box domain-containing protein n=1 Tax=Clathrus columnatus TaxID=1419009 RepID=A0AAV4ZY82_9AGAM|nr:hypothetical protein Clacol_001431 [Clathrus columnatus]
MTSIDWEILDGSLDFLHDWVVKSCTDGENTATLDRLLEKLQRSYKILFSTVNTRRNELLPINRLPTELFGNIIQFISEPLTVDDPDDNPSSVYRELSQTCRKWRDLILDDSRLWTDIDLTYGTRQATLHLTRAERVKLTMRLPVDANSYPNIPHMESAIKPIVASTSDRVAKLQITLNDDVWNLLLQVLDTPFPSLQHLIITSISSVEIRNYTAQPVWQQKAYLPFGTVSEKLDTLDIANCNFSLLPQNALLEALQRVRRLRIYFHDELQLLWFMSNSSSFKNLEVLFLEAPPGGYRLKNGPQSNNFGTLYMLSLVNIYMFPLIKSLHIPNAKYYEMSAFDVGFHGHPDLLVETEDIHPYVYPLIDDFNYSPIRYLYIGEHETYRGGYCCGCCIIGSDVEKKMPLVWGPRYYDETMEGVRGRAPLHTINRFPEPYGDSLKAFHIRMFALRHHNTPTLTLAQRILSLLIPKTPQVVSLFIKNRPSIYKYSDILNSLTGLNSLRHLTITEGQGDFFNVLLSLLPVTSHWPGLESVHFVFTTSSRIPPAAFSYEDLYDVVSARESVDRGLEYFHVENHPPQPDFLLEETLMQRKDLKTKVTLIPAQRTNVWN